MKYLTIAQVIVAILLSVSILMQNRGSGLGGTFGGDFGGYYTKRGIEKFLFYLSVGLGVAFIVIAITMIYISNR
jgi:protein translocase SecG subunit